MNEVAGLFGRASTYLQSARLLRSEGDLESAVSRTYYAMFFAAEAALLSRGLSFSSHKGVIAAFGEHFVVAGHVPREMGRELNRAFQKRQVSDYDPVPSIAPEEARQILDAGSRFVASVKDTLRRAGVQVDERTDPAPRS